MQKLGRSGQEWRKVMMVTWLLTCLMVWMAMPRSKIRNGRKENIRLVTNGNGEQHWAYWVWAICGTYAWRCLMSMWKNRLGQDPSLRNLHCKAPQAKASRLQHIARAHDLGPFPLLFSLTRGVAGLIPGSESWDPRPWLQVKKVQNRNNIVTNSINTLKNMLPLGKKKKGYMSNPYYMT